jgi:hypothetical protein
MNAGDLASRTQSWTGRKPSVRKLSRYICIRVGFFITNYKMLSALAAATFSLKPVLEHGATAKGAVSACLYKARNSQ